MIHNEENSTLPTGLTPSSGMYSGTGVWNCFHGKGERINLK
jgi:hypothetical protein